MQTQNALFHRAREAGVCIQEGILHYDDTNYVNYAIARPEPGLVAHQRRMKAGASTVDYVIGRVCVLIHGWGAGCGVWASALPALVDGFDVAIALDLPGLGLSSRPRFPRIAAGPDVSVDFFVRALDAAIMELYYDVAVFRNSHSRVLVGHSMGAYIAARWIQRTTRPLFQSLVLCSPAGMMPSPTRPTSAIIPAIGSATARVIDWCWWRGITPQSLCRLMPNVLAEFAFRGYLRWRAPALSSDDTLIRYLLAVARMKPCAESAICTLFKPGLWAHQPLCSVLPHIKIPVAFIYGEKDIMHFSEGHIASSCMSDPPKVFVVQGSKHSPFHETPRAFARILFQALDEIIQGEQDL